MKQSIQSEKCLIAVQFWNGDKEQAMALARLLADLESAHSKLADMLFVSRFDTEQDMPTIAYCSRKFNTFTYKSTRRGTGWPIGPNEIAFATLDWFYRKKEAAQIPGYRGVFLVEADCLPLSSDWLSILLRQWDEINPKAYIAGCWLPNSPFGDIGHINGNCFISGDLNFLKWLTNIGGRSNSAVGWDYGLSREFHRWGWAALSAMKFDWRSITTKDKLQALIEQGVVWRHGGKNIEGIQYCRELLGK